MSSTPLWSQLSPKRGFRDVAPGLPDQESKALEVLVVVVVVTKVSREQKSWFDVIQFICIKNFFCPLVYVFKVLFKNSSTLQLSVFKKHFFVLLTPWVYITIAPF